MAALWVTYKMSHPTNNSRGKCQCRLRHCGHSSNSRRKCWCRDPSTNSGWQEMKMRRIGRTLKNAYMQMESTSEVGKNFASRLWQTWRIGETLCLSQKSINFLFSKTLQLSNSKDMAKLKLALRLCSSGMRVRESTMHKKYEHLHDTTRFLSNCQWRNKEERRRHTAF